MSSATDYDTSALAHEDEGYHKGLKPRQLQMIAIGGVIGTGLFMGAGGRLNLVALLVIVPALIVGRYAVRGRVLEMARERIGFTGNYPVIAETPLMDELLAKDNEPKD